MVCFVIILVAFSFSLKEEMAKKVLHTQNSRMFCGVTRQFSLTFVHFVNVFEVTERTYCLFLGTLACTMCIRTNIVFFVYFLFFLGTASLMGADSSPHLPTGDSLNKFIPTSATTLV